MESIKISQESLDAFKGGKKLIPAPIDNKNLLEDPFEDDVFGDFYATKIHRGGSKMRNLIGFVEDKEESVSGYCEVWWKYGDNSVYIKLLAVPQNEDFDEVKNIIFNKFRKEFKNWECEDNEGLIVDVGSGNTDTLRVSFYFDI